MDFWREFKRLKAEQESKLVAGVKVETLRGWMKKWRYPRADEAAALARALGWAALDPAAGVIRVELQAVGEPPIFTLPKCRKTRLTAYPDTLQAVLEPRRGPNDGWVFARKDGPIGYMRWAVAFRTACRAAKVPDGLTLHGLRHTLNTLLRERGVSDERIRGSMGWSGAAVHEGYTHRQQYDLLPLAGAVDDLFKDS